MATSAPRIDHSMQFTSRQGFLLTWLLLSALAVTVCSLTWPAAHLGAERLPVGNDAFYHARRILDAANDPAAFYQFDTHIHAPEGSLLVWPWGYDYAMAWLVRIGMQLHLAEQPISILVWIPVAAVLLSIGLIMLVARRMSLPLWCAGLAAACVALSPLTQYLHGVGFIDHHFAEYLLLLATLAFGLQWFTEPASIRSALLLGVVLGLAPAVHNALFILQLPILATLLIRWLLDQRMPSQATGWFCASLLASTSVALIPSLPFRSGMSEFYLLSWFHLYVAASTALCCAFLAHWRFTAKHACLLGAGALLLLVPLLHQITLAQAFLAGDVLRLDAIGEMKSPLQMAKENGVMDVINRYSLLICLVPAIYVYCLYMTWRERSSPRLLFWVSALGGLPLLLMQHRLHYFGSFALCIPLLMSVQQMAHWRPTWREYLPHATAVAVLLMLAPPIRNQLPGPMLPANDPYFTNTHTSLQVLAKACKEDPGVVLADNNIGHQIRYYTSCSVITDNFLLTHQDEEKIREMERLFAMRAAELPLRAPFIKYVLVRPATIAETETGLLYKSFSNGPDHLITDLLLSNSPDSLPSEYQMLYATGLVDANIKLPYLALYKINH